MTRMRIEVVGGQGGENVALYASCLIEKICTQYVLNLIIIFLKTCKKTQINKELHIFLTTSTIIQSFSCKLLWFREKQPWSFGHIFTKSK